jgi:hypothetical protein
MKLSINISMIFSLMSCIQVYASQAQQEHPLNLNESKYPTLAELISDPERRVVSRYTRFLSSLVTQAKNDIQTITNYGPHALQGRLNLSDSLLAKTYYELKKLLDDPHIHLTPVERQQIIVATNRAQDVLFDRKKPASFRRL